MASVWALDRAVDVTEELHARKVASLLNSQNRLRCANAALKRDDLARKEASSGRGAALARAEQELLQQDAVLRAFYNYLGKDLARKQIRRALEAGPKRIRPTTREELRWRLEDLRKELAEARKEEQKAHEKEIEAKQETPGEREEIAVQRKTIEEWKQRISKLEQENSAHQVEIASLESALQRLDRLDGPVFSAFRRPWKLASQNATVDPKALKEQLLEKEKAFREVQQERHEMQEELLVAQEASQVLAQEAKEKLEELQRLRHRTDQAKRRTSVAHQEDILAAKKELEARGKDVDEVRARRKSISAEQKGVVLDGKRRISVLQVDLERQKHQSEKDVQEHLKSEEQALAAQHKEHLEDIARSEQHAEAALELSRQELQSLLDEARKERQLAKENLETALAELHLNQESHSSRDDASYVESQISEDWIRVPIYLHDDKDQLLAEVEETKKALAMQRSLAAQSRQLAALHSEAEVLEVHNLQLQDEKRDLELRIAAAQFALKRWRAPKQQASNVRGCPLCLHCQTGEPTRAGKAMQSELIGFPEKG